MEGILCPWEPAKYLIFSSNVPQILYYALIPGMIMAIMLSIFVFSNNKKLLTSAVLLFISLCFFIWGFFALILFATNNPNVVMILWSYTILIEPLIYAGGLYLSYLFFDKEDISVIKKLIILLFLLPLVLFLSTRLNLLGVNLNDCTAIEGPIALYFSYFVEITFILWIIVLAISKYKNAEDKKIKKEIILFMFGIVFFLLTFSSGNIIGSFTSDWVVSQYGYFGMPIFIGFLTYLIVKYQAFNIKLLVAQALVVSIIILIASQFFFIQNNTNRILTAITLASVSIFGWWLAKSVKKENEQNELLKQSNKIIAEQKDRIEKDKEIVERANEELKRLDKAKTEFINIASHQLRTPISVISGVASMMLEGDMEKMPMEQKQKFYQSVWEKAKKLKVIVHDILNATSFANKKYSIMDQSAEPVDVPKLLGQIVKDFEMEVKDRDIDLTLFSEKNIPEIKGQKEYLEEAFINLINNAIKYTPSSNITSDVRAKREGSERGKVAVSIKNDLNNSKNILVEVKDNGIGIPEEAKTKLFQRFSRAQNAVNMYTDGTGLGLFIVKEIAEGHGGKVWFESELDKGTTFFVSLPVNPKGDVNIKERITQDAESNSEVKF